MFRQLYNETRGYLVQNQKEQDDGNNNYRQKGQGQQQNWKGTGQNKSRRSTGLYSTLYAPIQQEEIREITGKVRMGPRNKLDRRSTERAKCQSLCNDTEKRRSVESMAG